MKNLDRVFGNVLIGELFCVEPCSFRTTPKMLKEDQDSYNWKRVNRRDETLGTMLVPLCPECGRELTYDEAM